jgi:hypothetical protein
VSEADKTPLEEKPDLKPGERTLRRLIYTYLILLISEGALRKWVLPELSNVLLLAREPVVFYAYVVALAHNRFPTNIFVLTGAGLIVLATLFTMLFGHADPFVIAYGIRTNFLHIPFAFIIGSTLLRKDVIQIGKWWLWGTCAMTVIITMQFLQPQSAWINRGVGGAEGTGFIGALGRYRPPGTFSFIIGTIHFYSLSFAFLLIGLTQHKRYSIQLLALSGLAILIAMPVSISRSLVVTCFIVCCATLFASIYQKNSFKRLFRIIVFTGIGVFAVTQIPVFHDALEAFSTRWERSTSEDHGGVKTAIIMRVFTNMAEPFFGDFATPFFGHGIGAGTQVGSKLITGERGFLLGESEWQRIVSEYGVILGALFCLWRILLLAKLLYLGLGRLFRGNGIPIIILSTSAYSIVTGQLGQTTTHGFITIGIGLTIAAMRTSKDKATASEPAQEKAAAERPTSKESA